MLKRKLGKVLLFVFFSSVAVFAQDGYLADWFTRSDRAKATQPHWVTPVATTTARLEQEYRYDQFWQQNSKGVVTYNYDGGKGLELIPFDKVEVIFNIPAYIDHNDPKIKNGFGDAAFLLKYRLMSAPEKEGSYILTAFLGWSVPTGDHKNGAPHAVITPTMAYGKGFGNFDVQGTFGVAMPTADTNTLGRSYNWNNAFQYRMLKRIWPEVEVNSTFIQGGTNDGKKQTFVTPGILFGRYHLIGRVGITAGGGFQIATTHFHSTNHNGIFTVRFPF